MEKFYKVISRTELKEATDELLVIGKVEYRNPGLPMLHKLGYWPADPDQQPEPQPEEGYKIFDDGYVYIPDGKDGKYVSHRWRKLRIVDPGYPVLSPDQEILEDCWTETESEYIHVIGVYDVIDPKPEIDETTHHLKEKHWEIDREAHTKTAVYTIVRRVDEKPELHEKEEIVEDHWDYKVLPAQDEGHPEEVYFHFYRVMTVLRNPPDLNPGEEIVDTRYEDDPETNTRTYSYKVLRVIDNPPVLEPGQQIVERWYEDDEAARTRTWHYEVRVIVDNQPDLKPNEKIEDDWWEDDGKTRTHVYEVHRYIDEKPVLETGQDIIRDEWVVNAADPLNIVHTHVYEVRFVVDTPQPDVDETHFIHHDEWVDDGVNYTHVWDVWALYDEPRPDADESLNRIFDLGIVDDFEKKTRGRKWFVKPIVRNKPEDDPEGDFRWVEDGEVDRGEYIEILYRQVFKVWRKISKLKLEFLLFQLNYIDRFDTYLSTLTVTGDQGNVQPLKRFYDQANELDERHPLFRPYYTAAIEALGISEDEGERILNLCLWDPLEMVNGLTDAQKEMLREALKDSGRREQTDIRDTDRAETKD